MSNVVSGFKEHGFGGVLAEVDDKFNLNGMMRLIWDTYRDVELSDVVMMAVTSKITSFHGVGDRNESCCDEFKIQFVHDSARAFTQSLSNKSRFDNDITVPGTITLVRNHRVVDNKPALTDSAPWPLFNMVAHNLMVPVDMGICATFSRLSKRLWTNGWRIINLNVNDDLLHVEMGQGDFEMVFTVYIKDYRQCLMLGATQHADL